MGRILKYLLALFGYISAIGGTLYIYYDFRDQINIEAHVFMNLFFILAIYLVLDNIYLRYRWWRKQHYAEVFETINKAFENIHELSRTESTSVETIFKYLQDFCSSIEQAFEKVAGEKCGVCIKILCKNDEGQAMVKTLCRGKNSEHRPVSEDNSHFVTDNSDFELILDNLDHPQKRYYFKNLLPLVYGYKNSRFKNGEAREPKNPLDSVFRWSLEYRSTIVVPICPGLNRALDSTTIAGFICLDSPRFFGFRNYDLDIMKGLSNGIFNTIVQFYKTLITPMGAKTYHEDSIKDE